MDRIWLDAPLPAWRVSRSSDGQPPTVQANPAAQQWAQQAGVTPGHLKALAETAAAGDFRVQLGAVSVRCRAVPTPDGTLLWLHPAAGADGSVAAATASATASASGRRDIDVLNRALTLAGVSVWRIDSQTRRIHFNDFGFQRLGLTPDPAGVDLSVMLGLVHPDDLAAAAQASAQAMAGEGVVDVVARHRDPDGGWRTMLTRRFAERDTAGKAVALAGITLNLSQQMQAQRRADALSDQARLVATALGVGFCSRDLQADPPLETWDDQMHRLYGRAPALGPAPLAQWLAEAVHPQDRAWVADRLALAASPAALADDAAPMTELLFRLAQPAADGHERWVQCWSCRSVHDGSRMVHSMHMDVSERQRGLALQQDRQRLEQASREQSAFMARMSHELRTPMNAVLGFTRLLQTDREPLSDRQRQRLGYIATASGHLMALIDDLLAIAQVPSPPGPPALAAAMHVLCVEDNPVNLQLVRELIALRPALRLSTAVDGLSGVAAALAEPPDLVLLDLQLPDISGMEVMQRLRAAPATAACRIVALSADAMPEHIKAALAAGFDDYWTKPIQFDSFLAGIDTLAQGVAGGAAARP